MLYATLVVRATLWTGAMDFSVSLLFSRPMSYPAQGCFELVAGLMMKKYTHDNNGRCAIMRYINIHLHQVKTSYFLSTESICQLSDIRC